MFNLYTLEKSIAKHMEASQVPGLALAILQNGELTYTRGFGVTSIEDGGIPVTPETLFRIGSTTKALTGTALLRLVEMGKLDLDRPIIEYVPWLTFNTTRLSWNTTRSITSRMLLSHTSGLPNDAPLVDRRDPGGLEAFLRNELARYPLIAPPGKLFSYSNLNVMIAGCIAQIAYGKSYPQMMQELIFKPLNMKRTTFDPTIAMTYPLAQGHILNNNGTLAVEHHFLENTAGYPAGFAMSTAIDMAHFAMLHLNKGRVGEAALLSPTSVAAMQEPQTRLYTRKELQYGLTFSIENYRGRRMVGHEGAIGSFGCQFTLLPDDGAGAILLYNRLELDSAGILQSIFDRLLNLSRKRATSKTGKTRVPGERACWSAYTGTFLSPYIGLVKVEVVKRQLTVEIYDERITLQPLRPHLYAGTWEKSDLTVTVGFVLEEDGSVDYIVVNPYGDNAVFHLLECQRVTLETGSPTYPAHWKTYTGTYRHPDLGTYIVSIENGHCLLAIQEEQEEALCTPLGNDQFACRWGLFEFQPADNNHFQLLHKGHMLTLQGSTQQHHYPDSFVD